MFISLFLVAFDSAFPLRLRKQKTKYNGHAPWLTKGILKSLRHKYKLYHRKQRKQNIASTIKYKQYNGILNKVKREAKAIYFRDMIELNKHDIKQTWKVLNKALNKRKNTKTATDILNINGECTKDPKCIADAFNEFFINAGQKIKSQIPKSKNNFSQYLPKQSNKSMFIHPVNQREIQSIISNMKPKSSAGYDNVPNKVIKMSSRFIIAPITHVVNLSFMSGSFPSAFKTAKVIPIYKSGDTTSTTNY